MKKNQSYLGLFLLNNKRLLCNHKKRVVILSQGIFSIIYNLILCLLISSSVFGQTSLPFASTPLTEKGDLSAIMVEHIDSFLIRRTEQVSQNKVNLWHRDFSSVEAFNQSISSERDLLKKRLGVVDQRVMVPRMDVMTNSQMKPLEIKSTNCIIQAVRWDVLEGFPGLSAEGLLIEPRGKVHARIVLIPDADIKPEVLAGLSKPNSLCYGIGRQLADFGCEVLIPVLVNRNDTFSGNPSLNKFTNQTHREWIYRQGFEVGRTVIGYELQKIFSAIDWMELRNKKEGSQAPLGVAGYGEGGLLALYAAALDTRFSATLVSGYFDRREALWKEPIYRNVFGLLEYFGDAELAAMTWPRHLVVEQSETPEIAGPPPSVSEREGAAPGSLYTPDINGAKAEWNRALSLLPAGKANLQWCANGGASFKLPFSREGLNAFASGLNINISKKFPMSLHPLEVSEDWINTSERQERTVRGMERVIQREVVLCYRTREKNFWDLLKGDTALQRPVKADLRNRFWNQIGRLPTPSMAMNPRARLWGKTEKWTGYEVMLDVWPGVFAWGILLVPNDLTPGEKRQAVVCQHGLEGTPMDVVTTDPKSENFHFYRGFASRLADQGYVVFAPSNPYRGENKYRVLHRIANPIGLNLFSVIAGQHQRIVEWLQQLSFVDPARIGFYGLSYGGCSAMRIPALVQGYTLSICSANFNEWIRKCSSTDYSFSYMFTKWFDMYEWDLGHTFSYAEMAALIAPRPFMVERGYYDEVAKDQWVGFEFAKVYKHYDLLGLPKSTHIEYFEGPHTIHGVGTFQFLDRFLKKQHYKPLLK